MATSTKRSQPAAGAVATTAAPAQAQSSQPASPPLSSQLGKIVASIAVGLVFGMAIHRSRVVDYDTIREQMVFSRWAMMKMFLGATAASQFAFLLISFINPARFTALRSYSCTTTMGYTGPAIGGLILGAGMSVGGGCPGMLVAQLGAGVGTAVYTLIGAVLGAFVYGLIQPLISVDGHTLFAKGAKPSQRTIDEQLGVDTRVVLVAFMFMMAGMLFAFETLFPWTTELKLPVAQMAAVNAARSSNTLQAWIASPAWNPIVAGIFLGLAQLPLGLVLSVPLGASSAYVTLASQIIPTDTGYLSTCTLLKMKKSGMGNWWQIFYLVGGLLGAYAAAQLSGSFGISPGVPVVHALLGGFMLVFGARLAGGCPSGHGLSGLGLLSTRGLVAVAAMFAGGFVAGKLLPLLS